jgi:hypothetical protein
VQWFITIDATVFIELGIVHLCVDGLPVGEELGVGLGPIPALYIE